MPVADVRAVRSKSASLLHARQVVHHLGAEAKGPIGVRPRRCATPVDHHERRGTSRPSLRTSRPFWTFATSWASSFRTVFATGPRMSFDEVFDELLQFVLAELAVLVGIEFHRVTQHPLWIAGSLPAC